ncbi:bifunctional farnesyl-diphosphate farnesyltransferase/squalene synthase [Recurvomyces mirabilis]|uniref:Squalene synthase n=1 Tax=Recurvomyces mirabilis TaxID=574656 RepID=A0AAE0WNS7_9PEZI|nr:bifunctional farnesyl-diphosphate farnesyltransferase/squalene synthase [Recurvomyces mirabilis]KAK5157906.1 bifunctional farnesyl-diphosphate farnesyltransferase/squalene synthase [Recurvomyces mirabilis]
MVSAKEVAYYLTHVSELRSIIQWKTWHNPVHERDEEKATEDEKQCFKYLHLTSRSFAAVILELHPELLMPMTIFYLILRGLDTIEDDMTIPIERKEPLLRDFDQHLSDEKWTFDGNGPNEKDRALLVGFDAVGREFNKIKPAYKKIISDICKRMGDGMADYAKNYDEQANGVQTIKDYELYCHYVAGLVGEGCTRLFVEAKLANPILLQKPELMESMGQFLQQTNIIRDIREDFDDKRFFWPKEVWSKYVTKFSDLFLPENREKALHCQSEMVLIALRRADECLFYMAGVKEQSVFNFVAIPQAMAIATQELCFRNYTMFERNIKITKGQACGLMMESTQNLQTLCEVFRRYARKIHKKNSPSDPHFLEISIACGKIERWIESVFPTQTARTLQAGAIAKGADGKALTPEQEAKKKHDDAEAKKDVMMIMIAVFATLAFISLLMVGAAWLAGARFDLAFSSLKSGNIVPPKDAQEAASLASSFAKPSGHGEL